MKTSDRLATLLFLLAAPAARFLELEKNLDADGLPTGGPPYLPAVLLAAAAVFLLLSRALPARDAVTADFGGIFRFASPPALRHFPQSCAGVFLCMVAPCKVLQAISLKSINARKEVVAS